MINHEIENWALKIIDCIQKGVSFEDNRVELKSVWPIDDKKTARQLAAHANSAQGEPILWLIGIDEVKGVVGAKSIEISNWFNAIKSNFNENVFPNLTILNILHDNKSIYILYFTTDRPPYVVKNPDGGRISLEVPWREGNSTRTAFRNELLKILSPLHKNPIIEILDGRLRFHPIIDKMEEKYSWDLILKLYVVSEYPDKLIIPFHKCSALFSLQDNKPCYFQKIWFEHPKRFNPQGPSINTSVTTIATDYEVLIESAGLVQFFASLVSDNPLDKTYDNINLQISINSSNIRLPVILDFFMERNLSPGLISKTIKEIEWQFKKLTFK